jgi:hypothetical protein
VKERSRKWVGGLRLAVLLIGISLGLFIVGLTNLSWTIIPAIIFLGLGATDIGLSLYFRGSQPLKFYFGPKQSSYSLGWGIIIFYIGIVIINAFVFTETSIIILLAITLLVIGLIALLSMMKPEKRGE